MAHHTSIYGRINGATWKTEDYYKLHRINAAIIQALPDRDTEFPWINRSMFSIPNGQGTFREQIITFGASYKTLEYGWHLWIEKFEGLLKQLFWYDAIIHAEFEVMGSYQYNWEANLAHMDHWHQEVPEPIKEWQFKSNGPRTFEDQLK